MQDPFAETLLRAARQQAPCAVALTMAAIMQLDGHPGLIRALELLTDEARRNVPAPAPGTRYDCHVFAFPLGDTADADETEPPASVRWTLSMLEARINGENGRLLHLVAEAVMEPDFPDYIVSLAMLAGQPDDRVSVVHW